MRDDQEPTNLAEVMAEAIRTSVWSVAPVTHEPSIRLAPWQVFALPDGTRHFVGWNVGGREGRVSTAITVFDPATRRGITASGRIYELVGASGPSADANYVFGRWLAAQGIPWSSIQMVGLDALQDSVEPGPAPTS